MAGIDQIRARILKEAEEKAKAAAAREAETAARKAEEVMQEAGAQAADNLDRARREAAVLLERQNTDNEGRKREAILATKQRMLQETVQAARGALLSMPAEEYFALLLHLAEKIARPGNGRFLLGREDSSRCPETFADQLRALGEAAGGSIELVKDAPGVDNGFILDYGETEENCSWEAFFSDRKEELSDIVSRILFS